MSDTRKCHGCGEQKPRSEFTGRPPWLCRECYSEWRNDRVDTGGRDTREVREYRDAVAAQYWQTQIAAASLAQRGKHELALAKQKQAKREKRKDNIAIARVVGHNVYKIGVEAGTVLLRGLAAPFGLLAWMFKQLFG